MANRARESDLRALGVRCVRDLPEDCVPLTCADWGRACGTWPDGCGGLTADVAKFTVAMLNDYADKKLTTGVFKPSSAVGECMACHNSISWAHGKENCVSCHGDPHND